MQPPDWMMRHAFDEEGGEILSLHIAAPISVILRTFNEAAL
jgi:hypothetical protein